MKYNLEMALTIGGIIIWIVVMILWKERLFKKYLTEINKDNVKKSFKVEIFFFAILGGLLFIHKKKTNLP
jgi:peptidoglycan biosynthesis protein MviN/MurJ (putative lipid II flippase)